jgi:hypothetical protein
MSTGVFVAAFLLSYAPIFAAQRSTLDITLAGKTCSENRQQTIECNYHIGNDLQITIAGVGQRHASITFEKSDEEGDFYAGLGIMHGCVIVKRGEKGIDPKKGIGPGSMFDFAFISPKNGKVYPSWEQCKDGH